MGIDEVESVRLHAPGIGEIAVVTLNRRPIRQVVLQANRPGGAGMRARVDLLLEREPTRVARRGIADRTVGAVEIALVRDDLEVEAGDQIAGQDLRETQRVAPGIDLVGERRVAGLAAVRVLHVAEDVVPAALEAHGDGGQVAEHVLRETLKYAVSAT